MIFWTGGGWSKEQSIRFGGDPDFLSLSFPVFSLPKCIFNGIAIVSYYIRQLAALISPDAMRPTEFSLNCNQLI